jgi:hypothetical protein
VDTISTRPAEEKASAEVRSVRTCEVCGAVATERTLIGLKNDRRRNGPRWCLARHLASTFRPNLGRRGSGMVDGCPGLKPTSRARSGQRRCTCAFIHGGQCWRKNEICFGFDPQLGVKGSWSR